MAKLDEWYLVKRRDSLKKEIERIRGDSEDDKLLIDIIGSGVKVPYCISSKELFGFLKFLTQEVKLSVKTFLEIGVCYGGSFFLWSKFFPDSLKIAIDPKLWELFEKYKEEMNVSNILYLKGRSDHPMIKRTIKKLSVKNEIDFLFIDGVHLYNFVKRDFETYSPFVKKGGVIAFHDINNFKRDCGVPVFWNEIKNDYYYKEFIVSSCGIGAIVK